MPAWRAASRFTLRSSMRRRMCGRVSMSLACFAAPGGGGGAGEAGGAVCRVPFGKEAAGLGLEFDAANRGAVGALGGGELGEWAEPVDHLGDAGLACGLALHPQILDAAADVRPGEHVARLLRRPGGRETRPPRRGGPAGAARHVAAEAFVTVGELR